jgi:hypothetical protein
MRTVNKAIADIDLNGEKFLLELFLDGRQLVQENAVADAQFDDAVVGKFLQVPDRVGSELDNFTGILVINFTRPGELENRLFREASTWPARLSRMRNFWLTAEVVMPFFSAARVKLCVSTRSQNSCRFSICMSTNECKKTDAFVNLKLPGRPGPAVGG